jgi:hypothetical protein
MAVLRRCELLPRLSEHYVLLDYFDQIYCALYSLDVSVIVELIQFV